MQRSRSWLATTTVLFAALCASLQQVSGNAPGVATPLTPWISGIASVYGDPDIDTPTYGATIGSCGYGNIPRLTYPYWSIAALSTSNSFYQEGPVEGCGMCFQIQCLNNGPDFAGKCNSNWETNSITVMITDSCPECAADQFDVNAYAFQNLAPTANGRIALQYRRVTCTPQQPVIVRVDENRGTGGWMRLWVKDTAGTAGVTAVSVRSSGSSDAWTAMTNVFGADWEMNVSPTQPLDMLVTSDDNTMLTLLDAVPASFVGNQTETSNFSQDPSAAEASEVAAASSGADVPVAAESTSTAVSG